MEKYVIFQKFLSAVLLHEAYPFYHARSGLPACSRALKGYATFVYTTPYGRARLAFWHSARASNGILHTIATCVKSCRKFTFITFKLHRVIECFLS